MTNPTNTAARLDLQATRVIFHARDLPRMAAFYTEVLGLPVLTDDRASGWMTFNAGAIELALHRMPAARTQDGQTKIGFSVPAIEATWKHLSTTGQLVGPITSHAGRRMFDLTDHENNDYQFIER